jgi:hypothetical protein
VSTANFCKGCARNRVHRAASIRHHQQLSTLRRRSATQPIITRLPSLSPCATHFTAEILLSDSIARAHSATVNPSHPFTMSFLLSPARRTASAVPGFSARTFSTSRPSQLARMTLVGRLGADPELAETGKGQLIKYVVGTSHGPKDNRQTSWFRVASFAPEGSAQRDYVMGLSKG